MYISISKEKRRSTFFKLIPLLMNTVLFGAMDLRADDVELPAPSIKDALAEFDRFAKIQSNQVEEMVRIIRKVAVNDIERNKLWLQQNEARKTKKPGVNATEEEETRLRAIDLTIENLKKENEVVTIELFTKYPIVQFLEEVDGKKLNNPKVSVSELNNLLKEGIAKKRNEYRLAAECFDSAGKPKNNVSCMTALLKSCKRYTVKDKKLFVSIFDEYLDESLIESGTVEQNDVALIDIAGTSEEDKVKFKTTIDSWLSLNRPMHAICSAAATGDIPLKSSMFQFRSKGNKSFFDWYDTNSYYISPSIFKNTCIDQKPAYDKLRELRSRFPSDFSLRSLDEQFARCKKYVPERCKSFKSLENRLEYTYVTVQCKLRTVLREDVSADVERFRNSGLTEAEVKTHADLLDGFDTCKSAVENQYYWTFVAPTLKGCKKEK